MAAPGDTFVARALDGSSVRIKHADMPSSAFTSDMRFEIGLLGGQRQRLCAGPLSFGRETAFDTEIASEMTLEEEYSYQGGKLFLGSGNQPTMSDGAEYWEYAADGTARVERFRIAVWEGSTFSFYAHRYGGESSDLLAALDQLTITETPEGIVCEARDSLVTRPFGTATLMQVIPSLGIIESFQLTRRIAKGLPKKSGTPVDGGALYVKNRDKPNIYFLLVGENSVTYITPDEGRHQRTLLNALESFQVSWE